MRLTDTFNPFSVGQTCETRRSITIYITIRGKGNFSRRGIEGAERDVNHFSLFNAMAMQQLRGITCLTVRVLDPLLTSARGSHRGLGLFWTVPIPGQFLELSTLKKIISSEDRECTSGSIKTVNVVSEDFNLAMFKLN